MDDILTDLRRRIQTRPSLRYDAELRADIVAFVQMQRERESK